MTISKERHTSIRKVPFERFEHKIQLHLVQQYRQKPEWLNIKLKSTKARRSSLPSSSQEYVSKEISTNHRSTRHDNSLSLVDKYLESDSARQLINSGFVTAKLSLDQNNNPGLEILSETPLTSINLENCDLKNSSKCHPLKKMSNVEASCDIEPNRKGIDKSETTLNKNCQDIIDNSNECGFYDNQDYKENLLNNNEYKTNTESLASHTKSDSPKKRKAGLLSIVAMDELVNERTTRVRRGSITIYNFGELEQNNGVEVVADKETRNLISDLLSVCEAFKDSPNAESNFASSVIQSTEDKSKLTRNATFSTTFGYLDYCIYQFISNEFGTEKWQEIIEIESLSEEECAIFKQPAFLLSNEQLTNSILHTATSVIKLDFGTFLQKLGRSYFEFGYSKYGDLLLSIATNLKDFINNMDDIRRHFYDINRHTDEHPSTIRASQKDGKLSMFYTSNSDQLYLDYFNIGFVKTAARILYKAKTRISLVRPRTHENNTSLINIKEFTSLSQKKRSNTLESIISQAPFDLFIKPQQMDKTFPYHIVIDNSLNICQLGVTLNRLLEKVIPGVGTQLGDYFKITRPVIDLDYESITSNLNTVFILTSLPGVSLIGFADGLELKGQILQLGHNGNYLWFVGSPKVEYISQLNGGRDLYLSDIPLHDAKREVLLLNERTCEQSHSRTQLQVMTSRLKEVSKELALHKINTEHILDEMFPSDVAVRLMRDEPVPIVTKEEVSILFTDIVGFTSLCEQIDPDDVTDMLNEMYVGFDLLCETYEVCKIETIGDAYMCVSGLQKMVEHVRPLVSMAIEMVDHASDILAPNRKPMQIRVGIHSGSVVAGVVGTKMPRYCLFGSNVTFANKMESSGEAGRVHISPTTYLEIKHCEDFVFYKRPREAMPAAMQRKYEGHSFFVEPKRLRKTKRISVVENSRKNFMVSRKSSSQWSDFDYSSRKASTVSDNVFLDHEDFPDELRKQLDTLQRIDSYQKGRTFNLPDIQITDQKHL